MHIGIHDVVRVGKKLVAERGPNFVYVDPYGLTGPEAICVNWTDRLNDEKRTPMCIVGTILDRLIGIDKIDEWKRSSGSSSVIDSLEGDDIATFSNEAKWFLSMAQSMQDRGHTWDAAVTAGELHARRHHL